MENQLLPCDGGAVLEETDSTEYQVWFLMAGIGANWATCKDSDVALSPFRGCCVSSLAPELAGSTYSSILRETECLFIRVSEGSRSLQGYLEKRLESKKKKPPLLPHIRKIALSVHLTTTIKSWAVKRCIKFMLFLHPFLSSLQNTTSSLLYFLFSKAT